MPYIPEYQRSQAERVPSTAGTLNYAFTKLITDYIELVGGLNYQTINNVVGALEGAKLEFYRRVVSPYEDKKIKENGDVYSAYLLG